MDRRSFVKGAALAYAAISGGTTAAASELAQIKMPVANNEAAKPRKVPYKRIETEGAWGPLEMFEMYTKLLDKNPFAHPGLASMWGSVGQRSGEGEGTASPIVRRLADMGEGRISDMDASGVDLALTFLTAPGVQVFDAPTANSLASSTNDQLAEAIRKHPTRFAGLAAIAPQDPKTAAKEMERATKALGLKGAVVNSHTEGEYLDDPKFWDIFEAAEALNIGHGGEGIPYMLYRIDYWETRKKPFMPKLKMLPSDYMRRNIYITTSGLPWGPAIQFAQSVLGVDRVMYAMDYPYEFVIEEVTMTDDIPMSNMDKKKLFQTNAENVFSL